MSRTGLGVSSLFLLAGIASKITSLYPGVPSRVAGACVFNGTAPYPARCLTSRCQNEQRHRYSKIPTNRVGPSCQRPRRDNTGGGGLRPMRLIGCRQC